MQSEEELREAGWSDADIRGYMRGYESARAAVPATMPASRAQPRGATSGAALNVRGPDRDYEAWREESPGGRFHAAFGYRDRGEAYAEQQEATGAANVRAVCDQHELTYDRRPSVAAVRAIEHARGWQRQGFAGTTQEIQDGIRAMFPFWPVKNEGEPLVAAPEVATFPDGAAGFAAMAAAANQPRR